MKLHFFKVHDKLGNEVIFVNAKSLEKEMIALRREFHQIPEVAFEEFKTSDVYKRQSRSKSIPRASAVLFECQVGFPPSKEGVKTLVFHDTLAGIYLTPLNREKYFSHRGIEMILWYFFCILYAKAFSSFYNN